jgi:hypothetical protein
LQGEIAVLHDQISHKDAKIKELSSQNDSIKSELNAVTTNSQDLGFQLQSQTREISNLKVWHTKIFASRIIPFLTFNIRLNFNHSPMLQMTWQSCSQSAMALPKS